ncbi:MAG: hypothetical protein COA78_04800 [Blastopirellula sp.]|nr:MAG: hypothetical protein COA78_04800 [Blastopirellula sp.]
MASGEGIPNAKIEFAGFGETGSGEVVGIITEGNNHKTSIQNPTLKLTITNAKGEGKIQAFKAGNPVSDLVAVAMDAEMPVDVPLGPGSIKKDTNNKIKLKWTYDNLPEETPIPSITVEIYLDEEPPEINNVKVSNDSKEIVVTFRDSDLEFSTITDTSLQFQHLSGIDSTGTKIDWQGTPTPNGKDVIFKFENKLPQGDYRLVTDDTIKDNVNIQLVEEDNNPHPFIVSHALSDKPTITPVDDRNIAIAPQSNGQWLTNISTIFLKNSENSIAKKFQIELNGNRQSPMDPSRIIEVTGLLERPNHIRVLFQDAEGNFTIDSNMIVVNFDKTKPFARNANLIQVPSSTGIDSMLLVTFDQDDLEEITSVSKARSSFVVKKQTGENVFGDSITIKNILGVDGRVVKLDLGSLVAGQYRLTVKTELKDKAGNAAVAQVLYFTVQAGRQFAKHVEYPQYAPPAKQDIPRDGFNPQDFVATRVVRLFYYRDAHHVAQILNRNVRSYNHAAVTQAERRAEVARVDAEDKTDARRSAERNAIRAAQDTRRVESQLSAAIEVAGIVEGINSKISENAASIAIITTAITNITGGTEDDVNKRASLNDQKTALVKYNDQLGIQKTQLGGATIENQVRELEQQVAGLRNSELDMQETAATAGAVEDRAAAERFRQEVAAATEDPGTYVPGDVGSVDPVTQVSISVIGEGLIHLRGPIKGINKIRTMINQIDSPVGQIKIGIITVQVNGEKGDKMEKVIGDIEGHIDLSRALVNKSLNLLRRSIQTEAAMIAAQCDEGGHYQVDRDRRYLYSFFGRDFIDELYAMNSEFLYTENKLLSLHAMDTVSLNRALFILSLAKNDVRQRIVTRFLESAKTDLADAEYDLRRSSELKPHRTQKHLPPWNLTHLPVWNKPKKEEMIYEAVHRNAMQRYHFTNFHGHFDIGFTNPDTMNPMQREFIRLAQIFKARMVAEMEWKQRFIERGLIEDRSNDDNYRRDLLEPVHRQALELERDAMLSMVEAAKNSAGAINKIHAALAIIKMALAGQNEIFSGENVVLSMQMMGNTEADILKALKALKQKFINFSTASWASDVDKKKYKTAIDKIDKAIKEWGNGSGFTMFSTQSNFIDQTLSIARNKSTPYQELERLVRKYQVITDSPNSSLTDISTAYLDIVGRLAESDFKGATGVPSFQQHLKASYDAVFSARQSDNRIKEAREVAKKTRGDLDHRKLLDYLIDEQEDKFIELVEGTRSHIAVIDQYLKRLSIALEDDFKVQFYDPAFVRVRDAARSAEVNLGQVERTTILTNNRSFAKVDPQATMEFDLPKRQIAIKEAFDAAKALVEDTGALINDPTFLAAFQMMGGSNQASTVKNLVPGQSSTTDQQLMGHAPPPEFSGAPGSSLQNLVPEPSVYKIETGTGFQIRPVIQPDGDSVIYDFDYMYTTNIREPVRADEKHIGRIRRHYIQTSVQTSSFELREISRYQVALKVSRTSRGVPLLEDIPFLGAVFRPAASAESSIQQNIILGQTTVYPTLYDLMGLRWAPQVVDLDHTALLEKEHVIRGRQQAIRNYVFDVASRRVDEFLDIQKKTPEHYRPDFYHQESHRSPYHPNGHTYIPKDKSNPVVDPTGQQFQRRDRRPMDMQEPTYEQYRHRPTYPEQIEAQRVPENAPLPQGYDNLEPVPLQPMPTPAGNDNAAIRQRGNYQQPRVIAPANYIRPVPSGYSQELRLLPPVR